jgi:predicted MFS family arabinose efflux permease
LALGAIGGSWLARIPDIQKNVGVDTGVLGTILLISAFAGLAVMQLAPHLLRRFGHRRVLGVLAPVYPLLMIGIPLADSALHLTLALVLTSSVGSLVGAGIAGILAGQHVSVLASMSAAAVLHLIIIAAVITWLLRVAHADPKVVDASIDHLAHHHHRKQWWRGVILIGALGFVAFMTEGAINDWAALYMREERGANAGTAVIAYVAFAGCMTIGRLVGDRLTARFGKVRLVRYGALLAAVGLLTAVYIHNMIVSVIGFALVGCGLSVLVPVLFSLAGGLSGGEAHAAVARVSTIAYFGLLVGPAFIGWIGHTYDLNYGLLVPAILLLAASLGAGQIRRVVKAPAKLAP